MTRASSRRALALLLGVAACGTPGAPAEPRPLARTDAVLRDPQVIDLGIPEDVIPGGACHTQGLAFHGGDVVIACVAFDPERPEDRSVDSRALVLRAARERPRHWRVADITSPAGPEVSRRVTRQELERDELTAEEAAIERVLSHPSGLVTDAGRGGVWVANAIYEARSHTRLVLLDEELTERRAIEVPGEHVGALALVGGRYLVGWTWDSEDLVVVDLDAPAGTAPVTLPNPLQGSDDLVAIQDCATWDADHVVCGGPFKYSVEEDGGEVHHRIGRLQLVRVDTSRFPAVHVRHAGYVRADLGEGPTLALGVRRYRTGEDDGDVVFLNENDYGGHRTHAELTHEGMTVGPDRRAVYFVPDDLPAAPMIRMDLDRR